MNLISPVGEFDVLSSFGPRWGRMHNGVDLPVSSGTIARAPKSGIVKTAGFYNNSCGGSIIVEHGPVAEMQMGSMTTSYCHMRKIFVKEGDYVRKGQKLGETGGRTPDQFPPNGDVGRGNSLGAHLHFGVKKNGTFVDPADYFRGGILRESFAVEFAQIAIFALMVGTTIYFGQKLISTFK